MTDPYEVGFSLDRAVAFNRQHAPWVDIQSVDPELLLEFPGLALGPGTEEFANATLELQDVLFDDPIEHDGLFGRGTWAASQRRHPADVPDEWIIRNGVQVDVESSTPIITWDEEGGLDLHRDGGWARRNKQPDLIVVHWGGRNAKSCRNALASRDLSSHFGTDRGAIYQWLDTAHRAWHAGGKANNRSIGIDICQQPTVGLAGWYESRGYGLETIDNPSSRGARTVLTLHPETVTATADLLRVLTKAFDIPLEFPATDKVLTSSKLARFSGVVGHHHISARKWDVAPWFPAIKAELEV